MDESEWVNRERANVQLVRRFSTLRFWSLRREDHTSTRHLFHDPGQPYGHDPSFKPMVRLCHDRCCGPPSLVHFNSYHNHRSRRRINWSARLLIQPFYVERFWSRFESLRMHQAKEPRWPTLCFKPRSKFQNHYSLELLKRPNVSHHGQESHSRGQNCLR